MIDPFHGRTLEEGITNPRPCNMIDIPPRSDPNEVFSQLLIYNIASLSLCVWPKNSEKDKDITLFCNKQH
jgi:hypothetical protein